MPALIRGYLRNLRISTRCPGWSSSDGDWMAVDFRVSPSKTALTLALVPALRLGGTPGRTYRVEYIDQFGPTNSWQTLTTVTSTGPGNLPNDEVLAALARHARGDWGDVTADDPHENELSLKEGLRLFFAYHTVGDRKFWIITEPDRSSTNVELHISRLMLSLQKC